MNSRGSDFSLCNKVPWGANKPFVLIMVKANERTQKPSNVWDWQDPTLLQEETIQILLCNFGELGRFKDDLSRFNTSPVLIWSWRPGDASTLETLVSNGDRARECLVGYGVERHTVGIVQIAHHQLPLGVDSYIVIVPMDVERTAAQLRQIGKAEDKRRVYSWATRRTGVAGFFLWCAFILIINLHFLSVIVIIGLFSLQCAFTTTLIVELSFIVTILWILVDKSTCVRRCRWYEVGIFPLQRRIWFVLGVMNVLQTVPCSIHLHKTGSRNLKRVINLPSVYRKRPSLRMPALPTWHLPDRRRRERPDPSSSRSWTRLCQ